MFDTLKRLFTPCWLAVAALLALVLQPVTAEAQTPDGWLARTQWRLDSLCSQPIMTETQLGLCILDLTDGLQVYQHGARQRLRPASTMKVVTSVTAMATVMGDADCFSLRCWSCGDGSAPDIVLAGGMDPLLGYDDLCALADSMAAARLTAVGDIWLDVTLADTTRWGEGWCWDDESEAMTPFLYDSEKGQTAKAKAPRQRENTVRKAWDKMPEAPFIDGLTRALRERGIAVRGRIRRTMTRMAPRTPLYAERGMQVDGKTYVARVGHSWQEVLTPMMKDSDNRAAEAMLRQLGLLCDEPCPSLQRIRAPFDSLCVYLGLDPETYRVADGSGRSLYNYVTAELLCRMLNYAALQPWYPMFRESLPTMGVDGTLKRRCIGTSARYNVWAKTGSVTGVSSLAGYAVSSEGHLLCFAIINQGVRKAAAGREFQDIVCRIMTE